MPNQRFVYDRNALELYFYRERQRQIAEKGMLSIVTHIIKMEFLSQAVKIHLTYNWEYETLSFNFSPEQDATVSLRPVCRFLQKPRKYKLGDTTLEDILNTTARTLASFRFCKECRVIFCAIEFAGLDEFCKKLVERNAFAETCNECLENKICRKARSAAAQRKRSARSKSPAVNRNQPSALREEDSEDEGLSWEELETQAKLPEDSEEESKEEGLSWDKSEGLGWEELESQAKSAQATASELETEINDAQKTITGEIGILTAEKLSWEALEAQTKCAQVTASELEREINEAQKTIAGELEILAGEVW
jgi:hypothetical protein